MLDTFYTETNYTAVFDKSKLVIESSCGEAMNRHRTDARLQFERCGFPDSSLEESQYTNLKQALQNPFELSLIKPGHEVNLLNAFQCDVPDINTHNIFLLNGWYIKQNLLKSGLPEGVILCSMSEASVKYPDLVNRYYHRQAKASNDGMVHFNTMFSQDGIFLYVPKNTLVEKPIQIINILNSTTDLFVNQRGLFIIEDGSAAKILICDHADTQNHFASNHVREVFVGNNANFDIYLIENQHNLVTQVISTFIEQGRDSNVLSNFITLHNGLTRNNTFVKLAGENAEAHLYGLALTDKTQHVDNYTFIEHAVPHCRSTELFKYILDDHSTGAFRGRILVAPDAQKTEAFQTNNNVCLSKDAKIYSKPQLEIYADDVKCSHGATVGQLDEQALFYMRARGISEREAKMLLMFAFSHEVVENVRLAPLQERLHDLVERRLRGEISKCVGCAICNTNH